MKGVNVIASGNMKTSETGALGGCIVSQGQLHSGMISQGQQILPIQVSEMGVTRLCVLYCSTRYGALPNTQLMGLQIVITVHSLKVWPLHWSTSHLKTSTLVKVYEFLKVVSIDIHTRINSVNRDY